MLFKIGRNAAVFNSFVNSLSQVQIISYFCLIHPSFVQRRLRDEVLKTTIDGIETFRKQCERGVAGDNVVLLLRGITKYEVERGMVLAKPRSIKTHTKFKAVIYVLKPEEGGKKTPFHSGYKPQFYFRTTDVTGEMVELRDGEDKEVVEMVIPGDNINATVHLINNFVMSVGLRFAIREGGRTIGVGTILEILE
jgi:elongation factor Tu